MKNIAQQDNPADVFQPPLIFVLGDNKMTTGNEKYIKDKMAPMTTEQARKALTNGEFGPTSSEDYKFASSVLARKESDLREAIDRDTLSIARKALRNSNWANIIAITAIIIAIIAIVVPLLTKN